MSAPQNGPIGNSTERFPVSSSWLLPFLSPEILLIGHRDMSDSPTNAARLDGSGPLYRGLTYMKERDPLNFA
jgi:hypothetical protein